MCHWKSGRTLRGGTILCPADTDSHAEMPCRDTGLGESCPWQYVPTKKWRPPADGIMRRSNWLGWRFIVHDGAEPSWWTVDHAEAAIAEARRVVRSQIVIDGTCELRAGTLAVAAGSPTIRVRGGRVLVFGDAAPRIVLYGGAVGCFDRSRPKVTQYGGEVWVVNEAEARVTKHGGKIERREQGRAVVRKSPRKSGKASKEE